MPNRPGKRLWNRTSITQILLTPCGPGSQGAGLASQFPHLLLEITCLPHRWLCPSHGLRATPLKCFSFSPSVPASSIVNILHCRCAWRNLRNQHGPIAIKQTPDFIQILLAFPFKSSFYSRIQSRYHTAFRLLGPVILSHLSLYFMQCTCFKN